MSGRFIERVFSRARGTPVARRLKAAGLDVEAVQSDYPAHELPGWLTDFAIAMHPGVSAAEALRRAGRELVQALPARGTLDETMSDLPTALARAGNFFDVSVQQAAPHRYVAHFDDVGFVPTFILGVMEGVTSSSSASVSWSPAGLSGARYVVTTRS